MYCTFCRNKLGSNAAFCGRCGKAVGPEQIEIPAPTGSLRPSSSKIWVFPVLLLLFMISGTVTLGAFGSLYSWLFSAIGLLAVLILWSAKCIKPPKISPDALCIPFAILILELFRKFGFDIFHIFACSLGNSFIASAAITASISLSVENTWGANSLWLWGLFTWFLLLRSGTVKNRGIFYLFVSTGLFIWSVILALFTKAYILEFADGLPEEIYHHIHISLRLYLLSMFIRRFIVFCFISLAGKKRLGIAGALLFPVAVILGTVFLIPIFMFKLSFGMTSVITLSLGYLFGVIVLLIALIVRKRRLR